MSSERDALNVVDQYIDEIQDEYIDEIVEQNPFHLVGSLFTSDSISVSSVTPEVSLEDALNLMLENGYSQLPVIDSDGYRGLVSLRSICQCLRDLTISQPGTVKFNPGDMRVSEAMDTSVPLISPDDNIYDLLKDLDRYEALVMGDKKNVQAVITSFDLVHRLWTIAGPYILAQEIELATRQIIRHLLPEGPEFAKRIHHSLSYRKDRAHPDKLEEMDLSDLTTIVLDRSNWPFFENMFGNKALFKSRFEEVAKLRNRVMHHNNRALTANEYDLLLRFRDLLLDKLRVRIDNNGE